ncbi:MAG: asparagine synthase (glutamine-hydrolyzing) [Thermoguttaceae bacterium]|jgi:asparagine synthase (glutamine-hydrolysing)
MCGICGIFRLDRGPIAPERVLKMRDAMAPRGPDGCGYADGPGFALGHRRLSIIDLSIAGQQPMWNEDRSIAIVFNGEIYNFAELRPELEQLGHCFVSRTDTEVLLHGYETWGMEEVLQRIRGMFALAILDLRHDRIHLARDQFGKKPLFFRWADGELIFASSARAMVLAMDAAPAVNPSAVDALLWNSYIPSPQTIFAGVEKLRPGHWWTLDRNGVKESAYWRGDFFHPEEGVTQAQWSDRIEEALKVAVRRRFVADVPVGVLLSGGVDSSLVAALAAKTMGRIQTFCVANEDPSQDESRYAAAVAERLGTEHHVLPVGNSVRHNLPRLVAAMGEPLGDSSAVNVLSIAETARQFVTVVLTGDGGDEAFGGYTEVWAASHAERVRRQLPARVRPWLARAARLLGRRPGLMHRAATFLSMVANPLEETFGRLGGPEAALRDTLYTKEFRATLGTNSPTDYRYAALSATREFPWADRLMQLALESRLTDDYLTKVDIGTMAVGLEARCPFLDFDVMNLAMRMPESTRFRGNRPKGLLRSLARAYLPASGVDRPKQGFNAPIGVWLRTHWTDLVDEMILGRHVERRGWFCRDALRQVVHQHRRGVDHAHLLWALLILEMWMRLSVERTLGPDDTL